ncbi:MAG: GRAS family protein, partial [Acidobacteriota bacterium]
MTAIPWILDRSTPQAFDPIFAPTPSGSCATTPWHTLVLNAGRMIEAGNPALAARIAGMVLTYSPATGSPAVRLARVFANALLDRQELAGYTPAIDHRRVPSQDDRRQAASALIERTPIVRFGHQVAVAAIAEALEGEASAHVIDLGIGSGGQWSLLFQRLAARGVCRDLRLTGIDLPAPGSDPERRLRRTGAWLLSEAARFGIELDWHGIARPLEILRPEDLCLCDGEPLIFNAAASLHRLHDETVDVKNPRDRLLGLIHSLEPRLFTLVEAEASHGHLTLAPRLSESLRYYGAIFDVLQATLAASDPDRDLIEQALLGREIRNLVAARGRDRVMRQERHDDWAFRLAWRGFEAIDLVQHQPEIDAAMGLAKPLELRSTEDALTLCYDGNPIV